MRDRIIAFLLVLFFITPASHTFFLRLHRRGIGRGIMLVLA